MKNLSAVPVPAGGLTVKRIGTETIILTETGQELHTLDETGTFVWSQIDGKRTLDQILDKLCTEYAVAREEAHKDLLMFIDLLKKQGVVSIVYVL